MEVSRLNSQVAEGMAVVIKTACDNMSDSVSRFDGPFDEQQLGGH